MNFRRGNKQMIAAELSELNNMNTSNKEIDKSVKMLNEAMMTLKKYEAALDARGIKKKVNDATKVDIARLVDKVQKTLNDVQNYSVKIVSVKETL